MGLTGYTGLGNAGVPRRWWWFYQTAGNGRGTPRTRFCGSARHAKMDFARQSYSAGQADRQLRVARQAKNRALQQFECGHVVYMWRESGKRDSAKTTKISMGRFTGPAVVLSHLRDSSMAVAQRRPRCLPKPRDEGRLLAETLHLMTSQQCNSSRAKLHTSQNSSDMWKT